MSEVEKLQNIGGKTVKRLKRRYSENDFDFETNISKLTSTSEILEVPQRFSFNLKSHHKTISLA